LVALGIRSLSAFAFGLLRFGEVLTAFDVIAGQ
jgi:hypothetical protein